MKQLSITLYGFDELTEEIQQQLIDDYRESLEAVIDYDVVIEDFKAYMQSFGASDIDVFWSGFNSQGDGACFCCDFDTNKLFETVYRHNSDYDRVQNLMNGRGLIDLAIVSRRCGPSNFYSHENTVEAYTKCTMHDHQLSREDRDLIDSLEADVTEFIRANCRDLYKKLENHYEFCTSDACFSEVFSSMGECFTAKGLIIQHEEDTTSLEE